MDTHNHSAEIVTPRGSHVVLQGLTEAEAQAVADQFAPDEASDGQGKPPRQ